MSGVSAVPGNQNANEWINPAAFACPGISTGLPAPPATSVRAEPRRCPSADSATRMLVPITGPGVVNLSTGLVEGVRFHRARAPEGRRQLHQRAEPPEPRRRRRPLQPERRESGLRRHFRGARLGLRRQPHRASVPAPRLLVSGKIDGYAIHGWHDLLVPAVFLPPPRVSAAATFACYTSRRLCRRNHATAAALRSRSLPQQMGIHRALSPLRIGHAIDHAVRIACDGGSRPTAPRGISYISATPKPGARRHCEKPSPPPTTTSTADQVLTFAGAQEGIFAAMHAILAPDDHAITVIPNYQSVESVPLSICETTGIASGARATTGTSI